MPLKQTPTPGRHAMHLLPSAPVCPPNAGLRLLRLAAIPGVSRLCLVALALTLGHASSEAQSPMTAPAKPVFPIRGFDVLGDNPLPEGETVRVLAPFLRSDATIETLQKATSALEAALKERGYGLHRVVLPPQAVGANVRLDIIRFTIGKVTVDGLQHYNEANIRASLPELAEGQAPNFKALAVQTAIANESQGKNIQIALKESEVADQIDARIVVEESKPWNFAVSLANTGARETGRDRLTVAGGHANLFDRDHQFVGAYTTSIERFDDVRQLGLNYRIPVYSAGGVVGASYTRSTVVGNYGTFTSTGAGQTMGLNYSHYLPPDGGYRSYVTLALDDRRYDITEISGVPVPGQQIRRSRPLTLGYSARVESSAAIWSYNVDLSHNLSGGNGNNLTAYRSEDPRINSARFTALRGNANYLGTLGDGWLWSARGQFQYSPDALIAGEQLGLGGASSVRGTSERPISGDRGLFTSLELSSPELQPGLRVLGFIDAGWLRNRNPNATNKPASDHLASVGLGLRYNQGTFGLSIEWGRIVTGSVLAGPGNPTLPRAGDNKLHVNLSARF